MNDILTPTTNNEWEIRAGGMLVQKRHSTAAPPPSIRLRVKHGQTYHEVCLSPHSTFGELKRLLSERTGLHPQDQRLIYKRKDRDSATFLEAAGVKDRSKMVLSEDFAARTKRFLEMRRSASMAKAASVISRVRLEVDKLAAQVSALDSMVTRGGKVLADDVANLTELLMAQLVELDGVAAVDTETKNLRRMQVRRVQEYVERLDAMKMKMKNSMQQHEKPKQQTQSVNLDFFDSLFGPSESSVSAASTISTASSAPTIRFDWELF